MKDIPSYEDFAKVEPITKGWSDDKKYYVEMQSGERCLLRISDIAEYEMKKTEFEVMKKMSVYGIKMSRPVDFGVCDYGKSVYQLLSWCDGEEAKEVLYRFSEKEQYAFGKKAADILKIMEKIDRKEPSDKWAKIYRKRVKKDIELYHKCGERFDGDEIILSYLKENFSCISKRPIALMHEDFQTDNMVISPDGELYIIDFQMCGMTDPYLVLTGVGVSAEFCPAFAMGQMDGYFKDGLPNDFWEKYNYYMIVEMLYAFTVGVKMEEERDGSLHMFDKIVRNIQNGSLNVPEWYRH